jgi:hypothetical protein
MPAFEIFKVKGIGLVDAVVCANFYEVAVSMIQKLLNLNIY